MINLQDYIPGSNNKFKWAEALLLPSWGIYHLPSEEEIDNIISQATQLALARDLIGSAFIIHCWIRPTKVNCVGSAHHGGNYNALVGGASASAHVVGLATDFVVSGMTVDQVQNLLIPHLANFQLSMERNGVANGRNWIHLGHRSMSDGTYRIFNP